MENSTNLLDIDLKVTSDKIQKFIKNYTVRLNKDGVVIGLSGGLDSSVVLKLCARALGKQNVLAVILPERDSDSKNIKDAVRFAKELGVRYIYKKLTLILWLIGIYWLYPPPFLVRRSFVKRYVGREQEKISKRLGKDIFVANLEGSSDGELSKGLAYYRIKHRLRSAILFYYAELNNYLFVGCSNKSEWLTGYFVKYGDSIADIMPIMSLYKTQVFSLAKYLKLPDYILEKSPSPDLIPGIIDEDVLKIQYSKLDLILLGIERNYPESRIANIAGATRDEINRVREIMQKSEYLRTWPIGL